MKKKFVYVSPKSTLARDRFLNLMNNFHSCLIEKETDDEYFLSSLNKEYYFRVSKKANEHWNVQK